MLRIRSGKAAAAAHHERPAHAVADGADAACASASGRHRRRRSMRPGVAARPCALRRARASARTSRPCRPRCVRCQPEVARRGGSRGWAAPRSSRRRRAAAPCRAVPRACPARPCRTAPPGCGPPSSGWTTKLFIAPSAVGMSRWCSIMAAPVRGWQPSMVTCHPGAFVIPAASLSSRPPSRDPCLRIPGSRVEPGMTRGGASPRRICHPGLRAGIHALRMPGSRVEPGMTRGGSPRRICHPGRRAGIHDFGCLGSRVKPGMTRERVVIPAAEPGSMTSDPWIPGQARDDKGGVSSRRMPSRPPSRDPCLRISGSRGRARDDKGLVVIPAAEPGSMTSGSGSRVKPGMTRGERVTPAHLSSRPPSRDP